MSTWLGFESPKIDLGSSIQGVRDTLETAITSYGWQSKRRSLNPIAFPTTNMVNYGSAMDMVDNTDAGTGGVGSAIIGLQLPTNFTPTTMFLSCHPDPSTAPNTFVLEYSADGNAWSPLQTWSNESNWFTTEQRVYTVVGASPYTYWRLRVNSANSATLYIREWSLEDATGNRTTNNVFVDVIPPVYENIGNANAYEVVRLNFNANSIVFQGLQYSKVYTPQIIALWPKTAGAVACGLTLNGATVTGAVGTAGSSAVANLRSLYEAIKTTADSNFTGWTWEYQTPSPQNADDGNVYIYGTKNVGSPWVVMTPNGNTNGTTIGGPCQASPQNVLMPDTSNTTLYTDLVSGFIYYLQVCSRGIALATRTTTAFYGPIHACYGDNTKALAALPTSGFAQPCTPIELLIGWDDVSTNSGSGARATHVWAVANWTSQGIINTTNGGSGSYDTNWANAFSKSRVRDKLLDYYMHSGYYQNSNVTLFGSNMFNGGSNVGNDFQIHRVNCAGETIGGNDGSIVPIVPALDITDWYKFVGTATDESLMMVADSNMSCLVSSIVASSDNVIHVNSTTGFQTNGYVIIEGEIIKYTNITSNTFTGCTRAFGSTTATAHFTGDLVSQGLWFTKINGGALHCGYTPPT